MFPQSVTLISCFFFWINDIYRPELVKDICYFKDTLLESRFDMKSTPIDQIVKLDRRRRNQFLKLILAKMATVTNKIIVVFSFTHKNNICDITKSPTISICKTLLKQGIFLTIFDLLLDNDTILGCFCNASCKRPCYCE